MDAKTIPPEVRAKLARIANGAAIGSHRADECYGDAVYGWWASGGLMKGAYTAIINTRRKMGAFIRPRTVPRKNGEAYSYPQRSRKEYLFKMAQRVEIIDGGMVDVDSREEFDAILNLLPSRDMRMIFSGRFRYGLSVKDIAPAIGVSENRAWQLYMLGRDVLCSHLKDH